jgi:RimJ/RimL family protein N-acetyltransferase
VRATRCTIAATDLLGDNSRFRIRPLLAEDRQALLHGYAGLSERSRRHRFQVAPPELPDSYLRVLIDEVDQIDHVALVAVVSVDDASECPVGVGRIVRDDAAPDSADIAVTVADSWQGRGIGRALARTLVLARPAGVRRLVTVTSTDNPAALALLAGLGPVRRTRGGHGTYEVTVDLSRDGRPAEQPAARRAWDSGRSQPTKGASLT